MTDSRDRYSALADEIVKHTTTKSIWGIKICLHLGIENRTKSNLKVNSDWIVSVWLGDQSQMNI